MDGQPMTYMPPHDIDAEMIALGSMLLSEHAAPQVASIVTAGDFFRPAHELLFHAIQRVRAEHGHANVPLLHDHLSKDGNDIAGVDLVYLFKLVEAVPTAANGPYFARKIRGLSVRRRVIATCTTVAQKAHLLPDEDPADAIAGLAQKAIDEFEAVRDYESGDNLETMTVDEFLAVPDEDYDWIVPGLLERGDRLMLTGAEGLGKSTLLRQLAITIAAGIHPFKHEHIDPKRVLIVDAENSDTQMRRKLRPLHAQARLQGRPIAENNLWIEPKLGALDLRQDKTVSWLLKRINLIKPDVLVIGPLYKLTPIALNSDDETAPILAVLDMIRDKGICLLMEAHAGHALGAGGKRDYRPRGSASLMGWPEFGYGVRPADVEVEEGKRLVELTPWRGDRDERDWPDMLQSGGRWPWSIGFPGGVQPGNPYARSA
jgi:hypothetical protein